MILMLTRPNDFASDDELLSLAANLVDPTLECSSVASYICRLIQDGTFFFPERYQGHMEFRTMTTDSDSVDYVIFLHLVLFSREPNVAMLTEAFSRGRDMAVIAQGHIKFCLSISYKRNFYIQDGEYNFDGSFFEVMAQLSAMFDYPLAWLLDQVNTATNISLLLAVINTHHTCSHDRSDTLDPCVLQNFFDGRLILTPHNTR
jgi:hypothetical protein